MGKLFGLVGLVVVLGVGMYWYTSQAPTNKTALESGEAAIEKAKDAKDMMEGKGMVSSIKDAMGLGMAMKCTYTMDEADKSMQSDVLVDGEKFRATTTVNGIKSYVLSDGADQYMWTDKDTKGFKMSKACLEDLKNKFPTPDNNQTTVPKIEDAQAALDMAKNVQCNPIESVDLTVPKDITFTDQCAMMKDSMKAMEQMKDKMPAGLSVPGMPQE